jgi:hypothetical protein
MEIYDKELTIDIKNSFILEKLQIFDYAKDFYIALCNRIWKKENIENSFSFREAARITAGLRNKNESYLEFYPSLPSKNNNRMEGDVTIEIETDFKKIGWFL